MFYAVLQKSLSTTYLNGDFFYFTLLTDMRFGFIGKFIQYDLSFLVSENLRTLDMMKSNTENYFLKAGPYILKPISYVLTWYTFCIELIISILFFLKKKSFYFWQHSTLLTFSTLYFIIPIKGFAASLLLFGFINVKKDDAFFKLLYLIFLFYIFFLSLIVGKYIF